MTSSYSPQRSSTKPEPRHSNISYGLRNPYDFQNDEPVTIRHEHKATPFRTTTMSSTETFSTNTNRFSRQSDIPSTIRSTNDISEIRSRILTNTNQDKDIQITKDVTPKKVMPANQSESKKISTNEKVDVVVKSKYNYTIFLF